MDALRAVGKKAGAHLLLRSLGASTLCRSKVGAAPLLLSQQRRHYADPGKYIQVERDIVCEDIAMVKMNKKPVNSMCGDFMRELSVTLEKLGNNETYRGAILTSAKPGIFSAGLDINEMYQRSTDHISVFWRTIHEFWLGLYGTDLAMVAAINGHAPAGGCLMALSCDYRIMSQGDYIIGLNETQLGILPPFWLQELMARACGDREAEMGLQLGTLYTPEEALKIGLVDEVVPLDSVVDRAREQVIKWLKIPDYARVVTKGMQRGPLLKKLQASQEEEVAFNAEFIHRESTQDVIEKYLMSLKKKKKKADGQ